MVQGQFIIQSMAILLTDSYYLFILPLDFDSGGAYERSAYF